MKRIYIYVIITVATITAALLAVSCVRELDFTKFEKCDQAAIRITPVIASPVTKAEDDPTKENGDPAYNETLISDYYWFIYDANGNLKLSGYEASYDADNPTKEILLDQYFPDGGSGSVYVVANLPTDEYTFADTESNPSVNGGIKNISTNAVAKTITELKALSFGKNTPVVNNAIVAGKSEFYNYTSATTGLPAPDRFVMRTESPVSFTLQENKAVTVEANLKRVAAKIILDLNVAQEVKQTHMDAAGIEAYTKTWIADIQHIQIYMLWGSTHGTLAGTPVTYSNENQSWFYFASPRYAMYKSPDGGEYNNSTNSVAGAVPSTAYSSIEYPVTNSVWEVVYQIAQDENNEPIWNWKSDIDPDDKIDDNIGNITYGDWAYILDENNNKIPALNPDGTIQRKLGTVTENKPYYAISSLPLYTMPIEWNVNDAHAPFIKIILPWQGCIRDNDGEGDIVSYDGKSGQQISPSSSVTNRKTTEFYYKILVPNRTTLDANGCYHISLDLSVLGSEADEVPVMLSGQYHVVNWNADPANMGGDQAAGRYLNCATHFEFYSQREMNIPVQSSHEIEVVLTGNNAPKTTYNTFTTDEGGTGSLTRHATNTTGDNYTIKATGYSKVTITHTMETILNNMASRDVAPITYTFRVQHADNDSYYKDVTVVQYPAMYIVSDRNSGGTSTTNRGYVYVNGTERNTNYYNWYYVRNTWSASGSNANPNMYVITASVLSSGDLMIGDPRGTSSLTEGTPAWATASGVEGTASRKLSTNYHRTENSAQAANLIAPKIRVASSWGAALDYSYDDASRRCASYQEDGLVAGRWRLPTAGEIRYIVNLSAHGLLPRLFGDGTTDTGNQNTYWCSNGTVTVRGNNVSVGTSVTGEHRTRCVYDEWYWGETKNTDAIRSTYRGTFYWGDEYSAN